MKTIHKAYVLSLLLLGATATSCNKDFDELTINENKPNSVPAGLLLNGILNDAFEAPNGQYEAWNQYYLNNYNYYGNNRYDFGSGTTYYTTLKNVDLMAAKALTEAEPAPKAYGALANFFRAYLYTRMSLEMGDIPQEQALQGLDNLTPAYDSQKAVFQQAFTWLESANTDLNTLISGGATSIAGDIYFNNSTLYPAGNLKQWQKVVNTLRLRLLLELSKKTGEADLNLAGQFASIVNNPTKYPLMQSAADDMQYVYVPPANLYPNNSRNFGQDGSRKNMASTYVGLLTQLKDPRVYVTCEPARYYVDELKQSPTDFASFVGAEASLDLGTMYNNAGLQRYSFLNRWRYFSTLAGEPSIQIGYAEQCFNIAEAINRGWLAGSAETYYENGIQTSMRFYGIPASGTLTAYFYRPGATNVEGAQSYNTYTIPVSFDDYYAQPTVRYAGGATGLTQILQQKYLALFRHAGLQAYYNYRRTGVPAFSTGGAGTGNSGRIALRFRYPVSERSANTANYQAALDRQFGGNDDINGVMYLLK